MKAYPAIAIPVETVDVCGHTNIQQRATAPVVTYTVTAPSYGLALSAARADVAAKFEGPYRVYGLTDPEDPLVWSGVAADLGTPTEIRDTFHPASATAPGDGYGYDAERYEVICNEHSTYVMDGNLKRAKQSARWPWNFCEECRTALDAQPTS